MSDANDQREALHGAKRFSAEDYKKGDTRKKSCGNCEHFTGVECRRFPPALVAGLSGAFFPPVSDKALCGEHEFKEEA